MGHVGSPINSSSGCGEKDAGPPEARSVDAEYNYSENGLEDGTKQTEELASHCCIGSGLTKHNAAQEGGDHATQHYQKPEEKRLQAVSLNKIEVIIDFE